MLNYVRPKAALCRVVNRGQLPPILPRAGKGGEEVLLAPESTNAESPELARGRPGAQTCSPSYLGHLRQKITTQTQYEQLCEVLSQNLKKILKSQGIQLNISVLANHAKALFKP